MSKTKPVLSNIEFSVVHTNEYIPQYPQRLRKLNSLKPTKAHRIVLWQKVYLMGMHTAVKINTFKMYSSPVSTKALLPIEKVTLGRLPTF